jgi:hypothetical protein
VYSQDVVFREIKYVVKKEFLPREEEPEKIEFEVKDNESTLYKNMNNNKKKTPIIQHRGDQFKK